MRVDIIPNDKKSKLNSRQNWNLNKKTEKVITGGIQRCKIADKRGLENSKRYLELEWDFEEKK